MALLRLLAAPFDCRRHQHVKHVHSHCYQLQQQTDCDGGRRLWFSVMLYYVHSRAYRYRFAAKKISISVLVENEVLGLTLIHTMQLNNLVLCFIKSRKQHWRLFVDYLFQKLLILANICWSYLKIFTVVQFFKPQSTLCLQKVATFLFFE